MANQIALHKIYKLWDLIFVRGDPLMPVFFAISLLIKRREMILNLKHDLISEALTSLKIDDPEEISQLFDSAIKLDKETPLATRNQMLALFYPSKGFVNIMITYLLQNPIQVRYMICSKEMLCFQFLQANLLKHSRRQKYILLTID
jgi:intracellular septation protein A